MNARSASNQSNPSTRLLVVLAIGFVVVDAAVLTTISSASESIWVDGFEAIVAALGALAAGSAALRASRHSRGRWVLVTSYFALLAAADLHDFLIGLAPVNAGTLDRVLETLGWATYLPLAILAFFPREEETRSPWNAVAVLDFAQITLVLAVVYFEFIYVPHHLAQHAWTVTHRADFVRNLMIGGALLGRSIVDADSRSRWFFRGVGVPFAIMALVHSEFRGSLSMVTLLLRPACLMTIGIFAARWRADQTSKGKAIGLPVWLLGVLPLSGPLILAALVERSPARFRAWVLGAAAVSVGLFVIRASLAEIHRQRSAEALRRSEARLRSFVSAAPHGITRTSIEGDRFLSVNPAVVAMLGYGSEAEVHRLRLTTDLYLDAEQRSRFLAAQRQTGKFNGVELTWKRKDGSAVNVVASGRIVDDPDGAGEVCEAIIEDVTERRRLEQELRQAQKMEAIGKLAGGVAHDFNNLLAVISGYGELLAASLESDGPMREQLEQIRRAAERAAALTRQLLAFSRKQVSQPQVLRLSQVIEDNREMLRSALGERIELITRLDPASGWVAVDRPQIEQVILNLVVNARDAMPNGGTLTIESEAVESVCSRRLDEPDETIVRSAVLTFTDTGIGMTPETQTHVFEPYFTTKSSGRGTGLGLATAYAIVEESGGQITVASEPGRGASFRIALPAVEPPPEATQRSTSRRLTGGSETVLLVEDVAPLRELAEEYLRSLGYCVLTAGSASEALRIAAETSARIELLITDVVLPGMSGTALADRLRAADPHLKVLCISGYAADALASRGGPLPGDAFLQKPFSLEELALLVRHLLEER